MLKTPPPGWIKFGLQSCAPRIPTVGDSEGGPGVWQKVNESMSADARTYQECATGVNADYAYKVQNGDSVVKFDGYDSSTGTLIDAKGPYSQFVDKNTGEFKPWYDKKNSLAEQAQRQIDAAGDTRIEWRVRDEEVVTAMKSRLQIKNITAINIVHYPMP